MRVLARALLAALVLLGVLAAAPAWASAGEPAAAAPAAVPLLDVDCKEAPKPAEPYGNPLALRPSSTSTEDPFAKDAAVSIYRVYGSGYAVVTYDNGCKPGSGILPSLGAGVLNTVGLEWPATLASLARRLQSLVVEPHSWIRALDAPVAEATRAVSDGFWAPWVTVSLLVVAALVLTRSAAGRLAGAIGAATWAVLVLVVSSWLVSYPTEATALVDDGVQTATVGIATGFSGGDSTTAAQALDRQWDQIDRATQYRTWLEGTFGSSTSATATTYGPPIFASTHFTWAQWDTYSADPTGKGKEIIDAKAKDFEETAEKVKDADPIAYDHLTGNRWMDRVSLAPLAFVVFLCAALFLVVSTVGVLLAYLVIRVVVPLGPAAGVFFLLEPLREAAMGKLQKVAAILVMGPVYLLAALVVLRINSAVLASAGIPRPLQYLFVAGVSFLAWRLIRPASVGGTSSKLGRTLRQAAAIRLGTRGLRGDGAGDTDSSEQHGDPLNRPDRAPQPYQWSSPPVAQPAPLALPAGSAVPTYQATPVTPGRFASGPPKPPSSLPHRQARALPGPLPATDPGEDLRGATDGASSTGPRRAPAIEPAREIGDPAPAREGDTVTAAAALTAGRTAGESSPPTLVDGEIVDKAPASTKSPLVDDIGGHTTPAGDAESSPPLEGPVLPPGTRLPPGTHESNVVFTEDGRRVVVIYRPGGRSIDVPAD